MGSNAKKKTTFAKINRENKLREKRMIKAAKKETRRQEAADGVQPAAAPVDDQR